MPVEQQTTQSHWSRCVATETEPWDRRWVVHLHRRAAFAASWPEIQRDLADGPEQAVDRLLQGRSHEDSARRFEIRMPLLSA